MNAQMIALVAAGFAVLALIYGVVLWQGIMKQSPGNARMQEIAAFIQEGSQAYLNRQSKYVAIFAVILGILLGFAVPTHGAESMFNWRITVGYLFGALFSGLAGYAGMNISVRANVRVAQAASEGLNPALSTAFRGGAVTGMFVVGLGLLGVSAFYYLFNFRADQIVGFAFGASLISLFARVGGGIYTKAADVGADLVGKVEAGIPEDDPRNPAVIADNVGDNVGDCAGMGADLFETYVVTLVAAMLLGEFMVDKGKVPGGLLDPGALVFYPLALGAAAILASIIGTFFVKTKEGGSIMGALYKGTAISTGLAAVAFYFITTRLVGDINLFWASLVGLGVMILMVIITEWYTSTHYAPVQDVAKASQTGPATNIISGLAVGMQSTLMPVIVICAAIMIAFYVVGGAANPLYGIYGIAIAAAAMLSATGMVVSVDSFGPITDNGGGIAEMAELPPETRKITDALDAVGNTTKAVTKGYAIGSAALAALALFASYTQEVDKFSAAHLAPGATATAITYDLSNPMLLVGLLLGSVLPFFFSSIFMNAVGRAAQEVVEEVRRQFREIPGIMERTGKPEYGRCVDIVTQAALREMMLPGVLVVIAPLVVGIFLGPIALGGLLVGSILSGLLMALMMTTGGATWDNAKKYIEEGHYGGKRTPAHAAAVVGDTVGDPFKDTAGPALNPMIKILNMVALLAVPLILRFHPSIAKMFGG